MSLSGSSEDTDPRAGRLARPRTAPERPAGLERRNVVTIIWITEEDRRRDAEVRRERIERDQLMMTFCRWLDARAGHDGPVYVPQLTAETEGRPLELFQQTRP